MNFKWMPYVRRGRGWWRLGQPARHESDQEQGVCQRSDQHSVYIGTNNSKTLTTPYFASLFARLFTPLIYFCC